MGGKKKQAHNAFYYFMLDFRKQEEKKGRVFSGMAEVSDEAGKIWPQMKKDEKKAYEVRANESKNKVNLAKYNSLGEDINVAQRRKDNVRLRKERIETDIKNTIETNQEGNAYARTYFFVAHVNFYCFYNAESRYIPAEISIVRFNLQGGVEHEDIFNIMLDTGRLPIGYLLVAKLNCDETHQIPLPPHEEGFGSKTDLGEAFDDIVAYLKKCSPDSRNLPPIYVDEKNKEMAENVFRHFCIDNGYEEDYIKVYPLAFLYYTLRNAVHKNVAGGLAFPSISFALEQLEMDIYDNVRGIACMYHEISDVFSHCAMSHVIRKVYIICDNCCQDLRINLIPGRHVPLNACTAKLVSRPPTKIKYRTEPKPSSNNGAAASNKTDPNIPACSVNTELAAETSKVSLRRPTTKSDVAKASFNGSGFDYVGTVKGFSSGRGRGRYFSENPQEEWPSLGDSNARQSSRRGRGRFVGEQ